MDTFVSSQQTGDIFEISRVDRLIIILQIASFLNSRHYRHERKFRACAHARPVKLS